MQRERDILVRTVFPEIRTLCRARGASFTDIDLRWGVTEQEAEEGRVVRICLEEIDRCQPHFLGLIGNRYGWQPGREDLAADADLFDDFALLDDAVTASCRNSLGRMSGTMPSRGSPASSGMAVT